MLAFTAGPAWGAHAGTIDQVQLSTEAVSLSCFNDFEPAMLAQRVTPAVSSWAQVDLFLRVSPLDGPGTVLTLNVRNDAIDGPIIASSSATRPLESGQPWVSFHFDPAVPLVPGTPVF
ncbi:MAG: hypothetical protein ACRDHD_10530, partial [Candidatus Limnocylindria bacterium]